MKSALALALVVSSFASAAHAADVSMPPAYDWTGFYIGLNAGAAINNSQIDYSVDYSGTDPNVIAEIGSLGDRFTDNEGAFTGGALIGYNWQHDHLVIGAEADINYLGFSGSKTTDISGALNAMIPRAGSDITGSKNVSYDADWFGTLRGRLGFASGNMLFYGTGGLAYGYMSGSAKIKADWDTEGFASSTSRESVNWGWTAGAGMEYGIDNWSLGVEYLYVDLASADIDWNLSADTSDAQVNTEVSKMNVKGSLDDQFNVVRATAKLRF